MEKDLDEFFKRLEKIIEDVPPGVERDETLVEFLYDMTDYVECKEVIASTKEDIRWARKRIAGLENVYNIYDKINYRRLSRFEVYEELEIEKETLAMWQNDLKYLRINLRDCKANFLKQRKNFFRLN